MPKSLITTSVGSLPKPDYLLKARAQHARGALDDAALAALSAQATRAWLALQEEIGLDILVDGEQAGDPFARFIDRLEGVRSGPASGKPVIVGPVRRKDSAAAQAWQAAQAQARKPVKAVLVGPYTLCDWSVNAHYGTRREALLALADVVRADALELARAGAEWIQIDEPALALRLDEIDLAVAGLAAVTRGLGARTITHLCCANLAPVYGKLCVLPVDQVDIEMSHNGHALLELFGSGSFEKMVGFGVVNVHHHRIETGAEIKDNIRRSLRVLAPDQVYVDPDCGLKTRTVAEAEAKLRVMVAATAELRGELGLN